MVGTRKKSYAKAPSKQDTILSSLADITTNIAAMRENVTQLSNRVDALYDNGGGEMPATKPSTSASEGAKKKKLLKEKGLMGSNLIRKGANCPNRISKKAFSLI